MNYQSASNQQKSGDFNLMNEMFSRANGHWDTVVRNYQGLQDAANAYPRQVPCPITGEGKTKFRFKAGWQDTGLGYHEDHGPIDIWELVSRIEGKGKGEAAKSIVRILGGFQSEQRALPTVSKEQRYALAPEEIKRRKGAVFNLIKDRNTIPASQSAVAIMYFE